jgi:hypothetical protein
MRRHGCKLVWCNTAKVFEHVPPERTTLLWLFKRFFRNGNITYQLHNKAQNDPVRVQMKLTARSCLRLAILAGIVPFWVIGAILSGPAGIKAVKLLGQIAFRLGFVARGLNFICQEYRPK